MDIVKSWLQYIYPNCPQPRLDTFFPYLQEEMRKAWIDTPARIQMFLAQVGHESGELRYVKELASGSAYEGRVDLGNTSPGDGVKYKGRGLIQLTGKHNYVLASIALNLPLLEHPELLEEPQNAVKVTTFYWLNNQLNDFCDQGNFTGLTKKINGGLNGLKSRQDYLNRAKEIVR